MLRDIRRDYQQAYLDKGTLTNDPVTLFEQWLQEAIRQNEDDPTAMTLSTAVDGIPDSRIVLLKRVDPSGFVFYTNYSSNKGKQISENNHVALNFYWPKLERQVRIKGMAEKLPGNISVDYFTSRPRDSQIGAWASPQSNEISSRDELDQSFDFYSRKFQNMEITIPPNWGGYLVKAVEIEFWQGRRNRLHDRFRYFLRADKSWQIKRLAP